MANPKDDKTKTAEDAPPQKQGASEPTDQEDNPRAAARSRGTLSKEEQDRADDAALRAGDRLDQGKPPTAEETRRAAEQAAKDEAQLEQERADAALRQQNAATGAEFQPEEGTKPRYISRGQHVNPDAKKATAKTLRLESDEDSDEVTDEDIRRAEEILARAQEQGRV